MEWGQIYVLVSLAVIFGYVDSAATCNRTTDCLNGGTCFKGACYCARKYIGDRCETAFRCKNDSDCQHNGLCRKWSGYCRCLDGYHGADCAVVYSCKTRNPCFEANLRMYGIVFRQPDPHMILVCDHEGRCLDVMWKKSPPGMIKSA